MAAVIAGMSLLQLAQLAEALAGAGASLVKIHEELKAKGVENVPPTHVPQVQRVVTNAVSDSATALLQLSRARAMENLATMGIRSD
jgi:uncharacterized protein (DUF849 family)